MKIIMLFYIRLVAERRLSPLPKKSKGGNVGNHSERNPHF